jgi:DNA modification methylase
VPGLNPKEQKMMAIDNIGNISVPPGRFMPRLMQGDCLERMREIEDRSVDAVICDLPFGTTSCAWDVRIPLSDLWEHYGRIVKPEGAIVLMAQQPFTSILVTSKLEWFKYQWVWDKKNCSGFASSAYKPLTAHEDICVFRRERGVYNPQMTERTDEELKRFSYRTVSTTASTVLGSPVPGRSLNRFDAKLKHPTSVIRINAVVNRSREKTSHPTQKPIALMEYLIRTYSNPGDVILDNCFGSCTTGIASYRLGRKFVGIEKHDAYYGMGVNRMHQEMAERLAV